MSDVDYRVKIAITDHYHWTRKRSNRIIEVDVDQNHLMADIERTRKRIQVGRRSITRILVEGHVPLNLYSPIKSDLLKICPDVSFEYSSSSSSYSSSASSRSSV
jgi:hypothetical protein